MSEPVILVVEDDEALAEAVVDTLELSGYRPLHAADGSAALERLKTEPVDLVLTDVWMKPMDGDELLRRVKAERPDLPVLMMTAYGTIEKAVAAMREGAADYLVKPFEAEVLVNTVARYAGRYGAETTELVGDDPKTTELADLARRVAASDATILITGESGTGKEVVARYLHGCSPRAEGPFVAVNCAAIPETMLEATLFGYEKGAFTGAHQASPGKFEQAQGGTLLLDEISEMDLGLQAKLLRVLQEREVERLGGRKVIELDVRVLATSNRDMKAEVAAGRFREDLYYRLNVFPLPIAPLRDRPRDILPLAEHLLERHARQLGRAIPTIGEGAAGRLREHDWPGNVRELDNVLQRALILQPGDEILTQDIHFEPGTATASTRPSAASAAEPAPTEGPADEGDLESELRQREQASILEALRNAPSRKEAAARLGVSERTLRYKLARLREDGVELPG